MEKAEMKLVRFSEENVIATSGGGDPLKVTWSGLFDGVVGNATLTYNNVEYLGTTGKSLADLNAALKGANVLIDNSSEFICSYIGRFGPTEKTFSFGVLIGKEVGDINGDSTLDDKTWKITFNNTYTWDTDSSQFSYSSN